MQQDKNDMENKLRQLENQQLPDLSRMDEHWDAMKAVLQPAHSKGNKRDRWFWLTGLLVLTVAVILLFNQDDAKKKDEPAVKQTVREALIKPGPEITNTSIASANPAGIVQVSKMLKVPAPIKVAQNKNSENLVNNTVVNLSVQLNSKDSTLKAANPDFQKTLNQLLTSLAKKAEEFIIDNSRDTVLFAAEGSSLYIPANSLGGSQNVKISLREFYKTSDIVMNKLSTTSNGEQLITGGMVHISATVNDRPVNVLPGKTIKWYLPDTSKQMEQMQLFKGEKKAAGVNWISTGQMVSWPYSTTEVRVLDLSNEPIKTIERRNGTIAVFSISEKPELPESELRSLLQEKYGYYKVRFRRQWKRNRWPVKIFSRSQVFANAVGDSAWIKKEAADKYKLQSTQTRIMQGSEWRNLFGGSVLNVGYRKAQYQKAKGIDTIGFGYSDRMAYDDRSEAFQKGLNKLQEKYSMDISSLGWINCDRFYNDRREKVDYYVNLQDSAINYYTMMVFNNLRSMMTGYITGNGVQFANVPMGEPVKIISIGIDKKGDAVMAMKETKISKEIFAGLQFESTSVSSIKSTLRKQDN